MGLFSFLTSDSKKSVSADNTLQRDYTTNSAYLLLPDGTYLYENSYEGYGLFNNVDVYEIVAKLNYPELCKDDNGNWLSSDIIRNIGIDIACSDYNHVQLKYPIKIVEYLVPYDQADISPSCPLQGYFYDDIEDSEDDKQEILRVVEELNQVKCCYNMLLDCDNDTNKIINLLEDKNNCLNTHMWRMAAALNEAPEDLLIYIAKKGNVFQQQALLKRKDLSANVVGELLKSQHSHIKEVAAKYAKEYAIIPTNNLTKNIGEAMNNKQKPLDEIIRRSQPNFTFMQKDENKEIERE